MGQFKPDVLSASLPGAPTFLKAPSSAPLSEDSGLAAAVCDIIADVRRHGDEALRRLTRKFDGVELEDFVVGAEEIEAARRSLDDSLLRDLEFGVERITDFAKLQRQSLAAVEAEVLPGVHLGHRLIPIAGSVPMFRADGILFFPPPRWRSSRRRWRASTRFMSARRRRRTRRSSTPPIAPVRRGSIGSAGHRV
jgi:hypothetical protein